MKKRVWIALGICAIIYAIYSYPSGSKINNDVAIRIDSLNKLENIPDKKYKGIALVDSFININRSSIEQNGAKLELNEGILTKIMLPLIDKKGLYDDIPFTFITSSLHNGDAYGNFVFEDSLHFIKVTCIIPPSILDGLIENEKYKIKFKVLQFNDGLTFGDGVSKTDLPSLTGRLNVSTPYIDN